MLKPIKHLVLLPLGNFIIITNPLLNFLPWHCSTTLILSNFNTQPFQLLTISANRHFTILPFHHSPISPLDQVTNRPFHHSTILPFHLWIIWIFDHFSHFTNQPFHHSTILPFYHFTSESFEHSTISPFYHHHQLTWTPSFSSEAQFSFFGSRQFFFLSLLFPFFKKKRKRKTKTHFRTRLVFFLFFSGKVSFLFLSRIFFPLKSVQVNF